MNNSSEAEFAFERASKTLLEASDLTEWQGAIRTIEQASAAGVAEATARCAIFYCMGVDRPMNWEKALDCLALSAEQGSRRSADQLAIMSGAKINGQTAPGHWSRVRAALSVEKLLTAPAVQLVEMSPRIGIIEGFASAAECAWLIQSVRDTLQPAEIYDPHSGSLDRNANRTNYGAPCNPVEAGVLAEVIRARLSRTIGLPLAHFEMSQILHYTVGQEFKPHHDYFDPSEAGYQREIATVGQRMATQLIYLNQDYEGGHTQFPSLGINYLGRTGDALMFFNINATGDPEPLTLHTGLPPTSGEKWIFSQWIRDRRPVPAK